MTPPQIRGKRVQPLSKCLENELLKWLYTPVQPRPHSTYGCAGCTGSPPSEVVHNLVGWSAAGACCAPNNRARRARGTRPTGARCTAPVMGGVGRLDPRERAA